MASRTNKEPYSRKDFGPSEVVAIECHEEDDGRMPLRMPVRRKILCRTWRGGNRTHGTPFHFLLICTGSVESIVDIELLFFIRVTLHPSLVFPVVFHCCYTWTCDVSLRDLDRSIVRLKVSRSYIQSGWLLKIDEKLCCSGQPFSMYVILAVQPSNWFDVLQWKTAKMSAVTIE